jgi:dethiobiotin synthase
VASAALIHRYRKSTASPAYWKPIQSGIEEDDDTKTVRRLAASREGDVLDAGVRLPRPLSPHLSARLSGTRIDLAAIAALAPQRSRPHLVEGAGGILVPINEDAMMIDLAELLELPVLVVSRTALGTINHTLLTLDALRARGLEIAGVMMVGAPNPDNRDAIERYGLVEVVGELNRVDPLTPDTLKLAAAALDPESRLAGWLT